MVRICRAGMNDAQFAARLGWAAPTLMLLTRAADVYRLLWVWCGAVAERRAYIVRNGWRAGVNRMQAIPGPLPGQVDLLLIVVIEVILPRIIRFSGTPVGYTPGARR